MTYALSRSWLAAILTLIAIQNCIAAQANGSAPKVTTRLILLGTQGGPRINSTRAQPANLLIVNGTSYLFDAGSGVTRQLALAHIPVTSIDRIFITHNHDDHNADWGTLIGIEWSLGRTEPIEVYGPRGTEMMLLGFEQYFATNVANRTLPKVSTTPPSTVFHAHDIEQDGPVYEDANIKVTALENCHYHYVAGEPGEGWQKSYALRVQTPDKVIVFSGDTGECGDRLVAFAHDANILVHEVAIAEAVAQRLKSDPSVRYSAEQIAALMQHMRLEHSGPETIGRLAAAAHVSKVVLTHLVPGSDDLPDEAYTRGVKALYSGPVVLAQDLMEID